jgi:hypothetical protein
VLVHSVRRFLKMHLDPVAGLSPAPIRSRACGIGPLETVSKVQGIDWPAPDEFQILRQIFTLRRWSAW